MNPSEKKPRVPEMLTEVIVPVAVGLVGVGISIAALTISILSVLQ